ncbi:MAG TPA: helix-turn-helix domain-containing protein [Gemmatimonadales bacterium]|nr:helix-turn-helix domain-containing protein [Gemmatimonadales bacterium]
MTSRQDARGAILSAAERLLRKRGVGIPTLEAVAREASCAKGLVNYHFSSKRDLLAAVVERMGDERALRWSEAFTAPSAEAAIRATWDLILAERRDGRSAAWAALRAEVAKETVQAVNSQTVRFATTLSDGALKLLKALGLEPAVAAAELGWYLAAVVQGTEVLLSVGAAATELEGAYAAAWLGILSLTRSAQSR